jgi:recombination protein RecT
MENKQVAPIEAFRVDLAKLQPEVKKLLPEHITVEKFERVVLSAIQMNPYLLDLDRKSLFDSCLRCASDGLIPDGREAALVPFSSKVQYMPMTYGIIKKIRNSGELATIAANVVHEKDHFEYYVNQDGEHFSHKPQMFGDRGEPVGVYALIKTKDGALYFDVLKKNDIMAIKALAEAKLKDKSRSPWNGPFKDEMWKKSAIRRLSKRVPMSADVERVIHANDDMIDLTQSNVDSKAQKIQKLIANKEQSESSDDGADHLENVNSGGEYGKFKSGDDEDAGPSSFSVP